MENNDKNPRSPRSVRLTSQINDRLIALCDHLGVTPNAYLVGVIGKAIATDEMTFLAKSNSNDMVKLLEGFIGTASQEIEAQQEIKANQEVQLTLDQDS
jgi:predicted DNA-binding protein